MKVVAIVAARMGSTRLPGKHLMDLGGRPMLAHVLKRARAIAGVDEVVLATTLQPEDDVLNEGAKDWRVPCFRYSPSWDVLGRYAACAKLHKADVVMRLTADCPLLDPALASLALDFHWRANRDGITAINAGYWLDGLDVEVFGAARLYEASQYATRADEREHVTRWLRAHERVLDIGLWSQEAVLLESLPGGWEKWSVDTPEDLARVRAIHAQIADVAVPDFRPPRLHMNPTSWECTVEAALRAAKESA